MQVEAIPMLINGDFLNAPLDVKMHLADYKMYGEDSYVFQQKELLHGLYECTYLSMNDRRINGEAFEYLLKNNKHIGEVLTAVFDLGSKDVLKTLRNMQEVANSQTAMTAVLNSQTAITALANSETAITALANSETAITALANSETAITALANSETAITALANSETAITALVNSETAITTVLNSQTAMTALVNSETAITAVLNSEYINSSKNKFSLLLQKMKEINALAVSYNNMPDEQRLKFMQTAYKLGLPVNRYNNSGGNSFVKEYKPCVLLTQLHAGLDDYNCFLGDTIVHYCGGRTRMLRYSGQSDNLMLNMFVEKIDFDKKTYSGIKSGIMHEYL